MRPGHVLIAVLVVAALVGVSLIASAAYPPKRAPAPALECVESKSVLVAMPAGMVLGQPRVGSLALVRQDRCVRWEPVE